MSWGKQLIALLALFCIALVYFIYQINGTVRTDMVSDDYISEAKNYQKRIEAIQRTKKIQPFKMAKTDPFIIVELPAEQAKQEMSGEILFYCVNNADLDKKVQLLTNAAGQQWIPQSWLLGKAYIIKMGWTDGDKTFYDEKDLLLK